MAWLASKKKGSKVLFKIVYFGPTERALQETVIRIVEKTGTRVPKGPTREQGVVTTSLELTLGRVSGRPTDVLLQTAPADTAYPGYRLLALQSADGVVFVAENDAKRVEENRTFATDLREHLAALGYEWEKVPVVVQLTSVAPKGLFKRRSEPVDAAKLLTDLGLTGRPLVEADTATGAGVMEALQAITKAVLTDFESASADQ